MLLKNMLFCMILIFFKSKFSVLILKFMKNWHQELVSVLAYLSPKKSTFRSKKNSTKSVQIDQIN